MAFREIKVTKVSGDKWVAYHPDTPDEQIAGSSPMDAIRRLNDYRREQEDARKLYRRIHGAQARRTNAMIAAIFVVVFAASVVLIQQINTKPAHDQIYAHHTSQSTSDR